MVEHFGPAKAVYEVSGRPLEGSEARSIHIADFGPFDRVGFASATCGASSHPMNDGRRVEGLMLLGSTPKFEAVEAVHRILSFFAILSEATGQDVRVGDILRASSDLSRFSSMRALLILPPLPFPETLDAIPIAGGSVELLWLLPLHESEARYAAQEGAQALLDRFAAAGLDLTDLDRPEVKNTRASAKPPAADRSAGRRASPRAFALCDDVSEVRVVRREK
jgi:hypothetical protein